jgi:hypothetical protein
MQWHPLFANLLRPVVEDYYDVQTNMAVGDMPREADLVLLRRTHEGTLPFRGLWKHLTTWNILEFKGPTASPRIGDLDLLVELGLGVARRLNEERRKRRLRPLGPQATSFWYLSNRLGRRFLRHAQDRLGAVESCGSGVWCCRLLQRLIFLVSGVELPVDRDSLPLHLVGKAPVATELALVRFVLGQPALWQRYSSWLTALHHVAWEEIEAMAKAAGRELEVDLEPLVKHLGMPKVLDKLGLKRVLKVAGPQRILDEMGPDWLIAELTPEQRQELKRLLR